MKMCFSYSKNVTFVVVRFINYTIHQKFHHLV